VSVAVATETAAVVRRPQEKGSAQRLFKPSEVTLEEVVLDAWEALRRDGRADCPVCSGELESTGCKTCGSELS
jgi:tRNA(Ile2) C34 agmatinyltransferase TiaS